MARDKDSGGGPSFEDLLDPERLAALLRTGNPSGRGAPTEPAADYRTAATSLFEMFTAYQQAGFSEDQSFALVCLLLQTVGQQYGGAA